MATDNLLISSCLVRVTEEHRKTFSTGLEKWKHLMDWVYPCIDIEGPPPEAPAAFGANDAYVLGTHIRLWRALKKLLRNNGGPVHPVRIFKSFAQVLYNKLKGGLDGNTQYVNALTAIAKPEFYLNLEQKLVLRAIKHQIVNAALIRRCWSVHFEAERTGKAPYSLHQFRMMSKGDESMSTFTLELGREVLNKSRELLAERMRAKHRASTESCGVEDIVNDDLPLTVSVAEVEHVQHVLSQMPRLFTKYQFFNTGIGKKVRLSKCDAAKHTMRQIHGKGGRRCIMCKKRATYSCEICGVPLHVTQKNSGGGSTTQQEICVHRWHSIAALPDIQRPVRRSKRSRHQSPDSDDNCGSPKRSRILHRRRLDEDDPEAASESDCDEREGSCEFELRPSGLRSHRRSASVEGHDANAEKTLLMDLGANVGAQLTPTPTCQDRSNQGSPTPSDQAFHVEESPTPPVFDDIDTHVLKVSPSPGDELESLGRFEFIARGAQRRAKQFNLDVDDVDRLLEPSKTRASERCYVNDSILRFLLASLGSDALLPIPSLSSFAYTKFVDLLSSEKEIAPVTVAPKKAAVGLIRESRRTQCYGSNRIFMPVNIKDHHWIAVLFQRRRDAIQIIVFDSLQQKWPDIESSLLLMARVLFDNTTIAIGYANCPVQVDSYNCGIHVALCYHFLCHARYSYYLHDKGKSPRGQDFTSRSHFRAMSMYSSPSQAVALRRVAHQILSQK